MRNRLSSAGSTLRSPSVVLEMIGKIATTDGAQHERQPRVLDPDDDERRDGDDRRHLQQHRVGKQAHLDPAALRTNSERDRRRRARSTSASAASAMPSGDAERMRASSARSSTSACSTAQRRRHEVGAARRRRRPRPATARAATCADERAARRTRQRSDRRIGVHASRVRLRDQLATVAAQYAANRVLTRNARVARIRLVDRDRRRCTRPGRAAITTTRVDRNTASGCCASRTRRSARARVHSASSSSSSLLAREFVERAERLVHQQQRRASVDERARDRRRASACRRTARAENALATSARPTQRAARAAHARVGICARRRRRDRAAGARCASTRAHGISVGDWNTIAERCRAAVAAKSPPHQRERPVVGRERVPPSC